LPHRVLRNGVFFQRASPSVPCRPFCTPVLSEESRHLILSMDLVLRGPVIDSGLEVRRAPPQRGTDAECHLTQDGAGRRKLIERGDTEDEGVGNLPVSPLRYREVQAGPLYER
jgi:hypothetical protein